MNSQAQKDGQRQALGRGLAALIPGVANTGSSGGNGLRILAIERLVANKEQPRKHFDQAALAELAESIKNQGVLQPILVRRAGENYEIVAGERRFRAATMAGLLEVPVLVKEFSDALALQVALIENIQRQDLDPLEEAQSYHRLLNEYKLTQEELATSVGKNRSTIANSLRLLDLPAALISLLAAGKINAGHARALMTLKNEAAQHKLAEAIVARSLSVREAEHLARQQQSKKSESADKKTPAEAHVEDRLQRSLGTKVRLKHRKGRGRIEVYFHSLEELDRILDRLSS